MAGAAVVAALASLLLPVSAFGWAVQGSTSGVTLSASVDDTQTVTFTVYTDEEPVEIKAASRLPVDLSADTSVTVSADSTLPVQVAGLSGVSDQDFSLLLILSGGVLGLVAYRGLANVWSVHRD